MPSNRHVTNAETQAYAKALVNGANEQGGLDAVLQVRSELDQIIAYNNTHTELTSALANPAYTDEARAQVIKGVFSDCNPALVSVLGVMAERGDFDKLAKIRAAYSELVNSELNVHVVDVTTRVELDDHLRDLIKNKAANELGGEIILSETVDPTMLGGIIMSVGGKRIDASMDSMLESARVALKRNDGGEH